MKTNIWRGLIGLALCCGLLGSAFQPQSGAWTEPAGQSGPAEAAQAAEAGGLRAVVITPDRYDSSPGLKQMAAQTARLQVDGGERPIDADGLGALRLPKAQPVDKAAAALPPGELEWPAPGLSAATAQMPPPLLSFDGVNNQFGGWPPDTQGDIGPQHYVQWINLHFAIWQIDRLHQTATKVLGPVPGRTLFQGFGGPCETSNSGDPITLFDAQAGRWLMGQFALPSYPNGPFYQCIAVSHSADPTGGWYRYQYQMPANKMNDYPKFGVWPNAYTWTVNMFAGGTLAWAGAGAGAFNRQAMISGGPAQMVFFDLQSVNDRFSGMLPADLDGSLPPPDDAPGLFAEWDDATWIADQDALRLWELSVDWAHPEDATFGLAGQPNQILPTQDVNPDLCGYARACLPQPGTTNRLDAISDRLMYRLQYRNFGSYATLVANHTVDVNGLDRAGIHWMELRRLSGASAWSLHQEGVHAPDFHRRWMGSIAMDRAGNIALGYSAASESLYPSVRYAGRLVSDPLGQLPQTETSLVEGSGSQTVSNRWGDYSMLAVDPLDDCTFWYTQEYVANTGSNTWTTRIGAFRFPTCAYSRQGWLEGTVSDAVSGLPLAGVEISATLGISFSLQTLSAVDGSYDLALPEGSYGLHAALFGYQSQVAAGVEIISGSVTSQNFALQPLPQAVISGTVRDAQTGWPLYARLGVPGTPLAPVWNDPISGHYSLTVPVGSPYQVTAAALAPGYQTLVTQTTQISGDASLNLRLAVDELACSAPGYRLVVTDTYSSDFEATNGGLTVSGTNTSWAWGTPTSGPGVAYLGSKAWATNLAGNYNNYEAGRLVLPVQNLGPSIQNGALDLRPVVRWQQWLLTEAGFDNASLEASLDNGATWTAVYGPVSGSVDPEWTLQTVVLDSAYAISSLRLRFRFDSDASVVFAGWYLDDLRVGVGRCLPQPGGLIVGSTNDLNTGQLLAQANLANDAGYTAQSQAVDGGLASFYTLFSPAGSHTLTATHPGGYAPAAANVNVLAGAAVQQDLALPAGRLESTPAALAVTIELGQALTTTAWLSNTGSADAGFDLVNLPRQTLPLGPLESPQLAVRSFRENSPSATGLGVPLPALPDAPRLAGGQTLRRWSPVGASGPWGVAYDDLHASVWVSSPSQSWGGDDALYEFQPDGAYTGRRWPHTAPHTSGPADLAYNWNTGMLWALNVNSGQANCIYEVDPRSGYTGKGICPGGGGGFSLSQRGLAYDPASDSWFAGGWNDQMLYRFDSSGQILSSKPSGLSVAGLAYNPDTQHLFVIVNASETRIYVLTADFQILGYFTPSLGFPSNSAAGLELDCSGNLWAVDQATDEVALLASGESSSVCQREVPWLAVTPLTGTLAASQAQALQLQFDSGGLEQPGIYRAWLRVRERTPYDTMPVPLTMTVTAPPGWGKLSGSISTPGYCDSQAASLPAAQLTIQNSGGITWSLVTDAQGGYQRWLDALAGPYTVTAKADGYAPGLASGVLVTGGLTTTLDFSLGWLKPCVRAAPPALHATLKTGRQTTLPLTLSNQGHAGTSWIWKKSYTPAGPSANVPWLAIQPVTGSLPALTAALPFSVTLNAGALAAAPGGMDYVAYLNVSTQDPIQPVATVPVTLTVVPLEHGAALSAAQTGQGVRGQALDYHLTLTNTGDLTDTYQLDLGPHTWVSSLDPALVGPLGPGETVQFTATVNIPAEAQAGDEETVMVTAVWVDAPSTLAPLSESGEGGTRSLLAGSSTATTLTTQVIPAAADLRLGVNWPGVVTAGWELTYTLTITNAGPTAAPRVTLLVVAPVQVTPVFSQAGCLLVGHVWTCELGLLEAGETRQVRLAGRPMTTGWLVGQAVVSSEAEDPQPGNNWATLLTQVTGYLLRLPVIMR